MQDFNSYFSNINYYSNKNIGVSYYGSSIEDAYKFHVLLGLHNIVSLTVTMESFINLDFEDVLRCNHIVFYQDKDIDTFRTVSSDFVDKHLFPLLKNNITFSFFSICSKSDYDNTFLSSSQIHIDVSIIMNKLKMEQLLSLLNTINIEWNDLIGKINEIAYTPIEKILLDELINSNMTVESQVRIDKFIADFLISYNNNRVIVECDGKMFHNKEKDDIRDRSLALLGYKTIRFSGSEIFSNPRLCVNKIQSFLNKTITHSIFKMDLDLDESQKQALIHIEGPCRTLAPAGSGKTKTLVNRVLNLINSGISEDNILALAFNKKAATEMITRLNDKGVKTANKISVNGVSVRTFHSLGYEIIRLVLKWTYDEKREKTLPKKYMEKSFPHIDTIKPYLRNDALEKLLNHLSSVKMDLVPVMDSTFEFDDKVFDFNDTFYNYLKIQTDSSFITFDDMVYFAIRILIDNKDLRIQIQNKYSYILVDEFQDLNSAQLLFLEIISMPQNNLFIVGDDDQMIYGWRGANSIHIIDFPNKYPVSKDYILSTNYRSAKKIVNHSKWLINNNTRRVKKDILPFKKSKQGSFEINIAANIFDQAVFAVDWVLESPDSKNGVWKNFAFLYRYHEYAIPVAMVLDAKSIPHTPVNHKSLFLKNPSRVLYSYLNVILNPKDATSKDIATILKNPLKYFPNTIIDQITDFDNMFNLETFCTESWMKKNAVNFISGINSLISFLSYNNNAYEFINKLYQTFLIPEFYNSKNYTNKVLDINNTPDYIVVEILLSISKNFKSINELFQHMHNSIHDDDTVTIEDNLNKDNNKIKLFTIHSTKGNEFENVVYFNIMDPRIGSLDSDIEEERRVSYVGVTRAISNLLITSNGPCPLFLKQCVLNPKFSDFTDDVLSVKTASLNSDKELLVQKSLSKEKEIVRLKYDFPELNGDSICVDKSNVSIEKRKKVEYLIIKNEYSIFHLIFLSLQFNQRKFSYESIKLYRTIS